MLQLINYSEKAIALFGETKPHAATLVNMNGRFNPHLNYDGKKQAGWIFSAKRKTDIENWIAGIKQPVQVSPRVAAIKKLIEQKTIEKAAPIEQTIPAATVNLEYKYRELNGTGKLNLARLYIAEIHSMQDVRDVNSAIANVIGYVTRQSFERFGDKNNITMSMAKTYFRKNGAGLDQVAMLAGDILGPEVEPEDVVNYIMKYPYGWPTCRTEKMKLINECYQEIYGKQMNRAVAKLIIDTYNEMKAEVSRNEPANMDSPF